jgi:transcriptional regulator with XRE-family HTH domain
MGVRELIVGAVEADARNSAQISRAAGLEPSTLTRYLRGERDLTLATAEKLLAALGKELRLVKAAPKAAPKAKGGRP